MYLSIEIWPEDKNSIFTEQTLVSHIVSIKSKFKSCTKCAEKIEHFIFSFASNRPNFEFLASVESRQMFGFRIESRTALKRIAYKKCEIFWYHVLNSCISRSHTFSAASKLSPVTFCLCVLLRYSQVSSTVCVGFWKCGVFMSYS